MFGQHWEGFGGKRLGEVKKEWELDREESKERIEDRNEELAWFARGLSWICYV